MKIRMTFALAAAALTLGVPVAVADPDGYQPDAIDRYVGNALGQTDQPDALARYLRNHQSGAASHPDSLAARPGVNTPAEPAEAGGFNWETGIIGTLGAVLVVLLAFAGAFALRERRRLVLR